MTKKKTKTKAKKQSNQVLDSAGRPTIYDELIVKKLEDCFNYDYTISEACDEVGISRPTYYDWLEKYPEFSYRMSKAQGELFRKAKHLIAKKILDEGDAEKAEWLLPRRQRDRYATKSEQALSIPEPLTPEDEAEIDEALENSGIE